jgi:uncharacterized protein (UPF0332 family)
LNAYAAVEWQRAVESLQVARELSGTSPDTAASRAYYAALHGVTAMFALRGQTFRKHAAIRAAVHRDLVRSGEWTTQLRQSYDLLVQLRQTGDYGGLQRVSAEDAAAAIPAAERIPESIRQSCPELAQHPY